MNLHVSSQRVFVWAALLVACGFLSACGGSDSENKNDDFDSDEDLTPNVWEPSIRRYEELDALSPPAENAIVVLGSSSILLWGDIEEDLAPLPIISRGFGGSTMKDAVYYVDRIVTVYKPKMVVIYEGDNDIAFGISSNIFLNTYVEFIEKVRRKLPDVHIYFISIKPSIVRWSLWEKTMDANREIEMYSLQDPYLYYINVASDMLNDEESVRSDIFLDDGLHMNQLGYKTWAETIRPILINDF